SGGEIEGRGLRQIPPAVSVAKRQESIVAFLSRRQNKRFPSRCASAIQIVRPSESTAEIVALFVQEGTERRCQWEFYHLISGQGSVRQRTGRRQFSPVAPSSSSRTSPTRLSTTIPTISFFTSSPTIPSASIVMNPIAISGACPFLSPSFF